MLSEQSINSLNEKLSHIVNYASEKAPAFQKRLQQAGLGPADICEITDLEKIPVTSKEQLAAMQKVSPPFGGLLTVPSKTLRRIYCSPGPIFHAEVSDEYSKGFAEGFRAGGFGKGDLAIVTPSYHMVPAGHWIDEALRLVGAAALPIGPGNTEMVVEIARSTGCTGFVGFPSFLMNMIKTSERIGYEWQKDIRIRKALVSGEIFTDDLRKTFNEEYGVTTMQFYANAEQGVLAYECPEGNGLHVVEDIILEIVDPKTGRQLGPGEPGEVVMTNFIESYPLIRLGTGDLSMISEEPCPCGRKTPRLLRILGRLGTSALRVKGLLLYLEEVQKVVSEYPQIVDFEVVAQRSAHRDQILVNLEIESLDINKDELVQKVRDRFISVCRLKPDQIELVPKGTFKLGHRNFVDNRRWN